MKPNVFQSGRGLRRLSSLAVCLLMGVAASAQGAASPPTPAEPLTTQPTDILANWNYRLDATGRPWLVYYDQERRLRLRDPDGQDTPLIRTDHQAHSSSGLEIASLDKGVAVLWRDKQPAKGLYLLDTSQPAMQPLGVGGDTEPLARFRAAADPHNRLHLLWYGEKVGEPTGQTHHLYYRNWNPQTQALSPIEMLMPGIYPVMSSGETGDLMVYSWLMNETPSRIVARYRSAATDTTPGIFGEPVTIAELPTITPIFESFRSGSRWFVVWVAQYGASQTEYLLEGAHSDDQGKTWQRFAFEDQRGLDIASLQVAADDAGHILIAVSGIMPVEGAKAKENALVFRSSDRGKTWSTAEPLRQMVQNGEQHQASATSLANFRARYPSVTFGKTPGQALVVWEDWRNIRSGLYASLSNDYGQTWTLTDVPLPQDPAKNLSLHYLPNAVYAAGERFEIIAEEPFDDSLKGKRLVRVGFTAEDLAEYAKSAQKAATELDDKAGEAALRNRAEGFWQAMMAGDYAKTYAYHDPFFRASVPLQGYQAMMGKIKYSQAQVDAIQVDGPRAEVTTAIRASVPAFRSPVTGETLSQPEREVSVTNTWLWVDGDWYQEFRVDSQDVLYTRY